MRDSENARTEKHLGEIWKSDHRTTGSVVNADRVDEVSDAMWVSIFDYLLCFCEAGDR